MNNQDKKLSEAREIKKIPKYEDYFLNKNGEIFTTFRPFGRRGLPMKLKACIDKTTKYNFIALVRTVDGKRKTNRFSIHRLMLLTWIGEPTNMQVGRHLNGIRHDNRLENLAWGTPKENREDMKKHGTWQNGERNPFAKLKDKQVKVIKMMLRDGKSKKEICEKYNIKAYNLNKIARGQTWTHINI